MQIGIIGAFGAVVMAGLGIGWFAVQTPDQTGSRVVGAFAVAGVVAKGPMQPNPRMPTFHQVSDDGGPYDAVFPEHDDPGLGQRRSLRENLRQAAEALRASPCDPGARHDYFNHYAAYADAAAADDHQQSDPIGSPLWRTADDAKLGHMLGALQKDGYVTQDEILRAAAATHPVFGAIMAVHGWQDAEPAPVMASCASRRIARREL